MLGIENYFVFIGACLMLNLYPGPDTMYIIGRSVSQGRMAGIAATLGISTGGLVHGLLACFGLSALLAVSAKAFLLVKLLGCGYLLYQGVQMFIAAARPLELQPLTNGTASFLRIFRQGALTNILNPKVALFFLAFMPQFISPQAQQKPLAFLVLSATFMTTGTIWCLIVALSAARFSAGVRSNPRFSRWLLRINGTLFGFLGVRLATSEIQP